MQRSIELQSGITMALVLIGMHIVISSVVAEYKDAFGMVKHSIGFQKRLKDGAHKDVANKGDYATLYGAVMRGDVDMARKLIKAGVDKGYTNKDGITLLHVAAWNGHEEVVKLLVTASSGKNNDVVGEDRRKESSLLQMLLQPFTKESASNNHGVTPLHLAVQKDRVLVLQYLLSTGVDKNVETHDGWTPLHYAAYYGSLGTLKILLSVNACTSSITKKGYTPLHLAALYNQAGATEVLIKAGANKEAKDKAYLTPLHLASLKDHCNVIKVLLDHRARKEAVNNDGNTSLHLASLKGCVGTVELLLQCHAPIEAANKNLLRPLHLAAQEGQEAVVMLLLQAKAAVNAGNGKYTPLFKAVDKGHVEITKLLIEARADVERGDKLGRTPLLQVLERATEDGCKDVSLYHQVACLLILKGGASLKDIEHYPEEAQRLLRTWGFGNDTFASVFKETEELLEEYHNFVINQLGIPRVISELIDEYCGSFDLLMQAFTQAKQHLAYTDQSSCILQ